MELKGIKNIIFDLGGVLLNLDFNRTRQAFKELGVDDFDLYYSKAKQTGLFDLFETGKIDETTFCEQLRKLTHITVKDPLIVDAWNSMLLDFPIARKKLLLAVKKEFNTVLLSNTNETHVRAFNRIITSDIEEETLDPLFHQVYFSNEIGLRKPNKATFQWVLHQNGYRAEETLFLDDSIQHIKGAQTCNIRSFHVLNEPVEKLFSNFLT